MQHNKIKAYLIKNNITDLKKYQLHDSGNGVPYIGKWEYAIEQPKEEDFNELTKEEINKC